MAERILDIRCPSCGGIAKFDIRKQRYLCGYCGNQVGIDDVKKEKQGFQKIHADRVSAQMHNYRFFSASCNSCGAEVYFEENEAVSLCPFCGKTMVRKDYVQDKNIPEAIIPFAMTPKEAGERLAAWCRENRKKKEARLLLKNISSLQGFYLPYELVYGPVHMAVSRMDKGSTYYCEGFLKETFINRSKQLDNLLLDGMEPFDSHGMKEFDYGYIAGQRVKISDLDERSLTSRALTETAAAYTPFVRKTLETKAVEVRPDLDSALRMPVLLPVYYIAKENLMAAVNGQTGKVSVRALKDSYYYFLPWWLKAIFATLIISLISFFGFSFFGTGRKESLLFTGILALFFIIVLFCYYADTIHNPFKVVSGKAVYTSGEKTFKRENGVLVLNDHILENKIEEPVFFETINGQNRPVVLKFTTPQRIIKTVLNCLIMLFLPVILALFINGFQLSQIHLGGCAVWFCIAVPVIPVYLLKFGIDEIYDRPLIYLLKENGSLKRYRRKHHIRMNKELLKTILRALFVPPVSLAVWFGILSFFVIVYLTAGYGW